MQISIKSPDIWTSNSDISVDRLRHDVRLMIYRPFWEDGVTIYMSDDEAKELAKMLRKAAKPKAVPA